MKKRSFKQHPKEKRRVSYSTEINFNGSESQKLLVLIIINVADNLCNYSWNSNFAGVKLKLSSPSQESSSRIELDDLDARVFVSASNVEKYLAGAFLVFFFLFFAQTAHSCPLGVERRIRSRSFAILSGGKYHVVVLDMAENAIRSLSISNVTRASINNSS